MEVQLKQSLHPLVAEMRRWRTLIGQDFEQHKLAAKREAVQHSL
jgi:hypothetical protein